MVMFNKSRVALAAAGAVAATMMSMAPAHAATLMKFGDFSEVGNGANVRWVKNNTGGSLFTIATPTGTTLGNAKVKFNFDLPYLADLNNLAANYRMSVTAPAGSAALNGGLGFFTQPNLQGSFSFIYTGPNTIIDGFAVNTGANLLSATFFNDAAIQGRVKGTAGTMFASTDTGSVIHYTSDFIDFKHSYIRDFSNSLNAVKPTFGYTSGKALNSFTASDVGEFGVAIPEPATWATTILGFGLLGATLRRRRSAAATA